MGGGTRGIDYAPLHSAPSLRNALRGCDEGFARSQKSAVTPFHSVQAEYRILLLILEGMICSLQLSWRSNPVSPSAQGVLGPHVPTVKKLPNGSFLNGGTRGI